MVFSSRAWGLSVVRLRSLGAVRQEKPAVAIFTFPRGSVLAAPFSPFRAAPLSPRLFHLSAQLRCRRAKLQLNETPLTDGFEGWRSAAPNGEGNIMSNLPLSNIKVIDLTRARAGPTAARQLADWGADVLKVEEPGEGGDFAGRSSPDFQNLHRNKQTMTLNLKEPEGVAILKRLADPPHRALENYRPDVKHRLGIDYENLRRVNPRVLYRSLSGFGQDGPYRDRP